MAETLSGLSQTASTGSHHPRGSSQTKHISKQSDISTESCSRGEISTDRHVLTNNINNPHHHAAKAGSRGGRKNNGRGAGRGLKGCKRGGKNDSNSVISSDEDVMIAFMHHLRSGDSEARHIYTEFGGKQRVFVEEVRKYLILKGKESQWNKKSPVLNETLQLNQKYVDKTQTFNKSNQNKQMMPQSKYEEEHIGTKVFDMNELNSIYHETQTSTQYFKDPKPKSISDEDEEMEKMVAHLTMNDFDDSILSNEEPARNKVQIPHRQTTVPAALSQSSKNASTGFQLPPGLNFTNESQLGIIQSLNKEETPIETGSKPVDVRKNTESPKKTSPSALPTTTTPPPNTTTTKWQPKRLFTRIEQQPGQILANNVQATLSGYPHIILGPRKELRATWKLPLAYLRERMMKQIQDDKLDGTVTAPESITVRDALRSLTVGLYRRGCAENGANSSIIAKEVVPSDDSNRDGDKKEYHFEINERDNSIWGQVPFYTPRTPGNVVLRLYFEDDPISTLATSQCIRVVVKDNDVEPTLRFVLSNFKAKKSTSNFSSIHSLAAVFEQFSPSNQMKNLDPNENKKVQNYNQYFYNYHESAGRAAWGCICESRKVVEANKVDFSKKREKLEEQENVLLKNKQDLDAKNEDSFAEKGGYEIIKDEDKTLSLDVWKEKMNSLMGERASNERKWREVQSAFASVLKAVLGNKASHLLFKRDIITKLKLEFQLWCPLCECFAPNPFECHSHASTRNDKASLNFPYPISDKHFDLCHKSRSKMQLDILGFVPKTAPLQQVLQNNSHNICQDLTLAMKSYYKTAYLASNDIQKRREEVRYLAETAVNKCAAFPKGTRVIIFGSSANGFGSPSSDLDMCLQLPHSSSLKNQNDENGSSAMASLASILEKDGMIDVDTTRLTARIPVVMFKCQLENDYGHKFIIECDLSMQNPLACLNTSLLHSYSKITDEVRILVAIIKRWAKARNINNPSHHTLSSYGYIIMLIHFLTSHEAAPNGLVVPLSNQRVDSSKTYHSTSCPLIPNLQWMDPSWPQNKPRTMYRELARRPCNQYSTMIHPTEKSFIVNTYFFRIEDCVTERNLQGHLGYQQASLAVILAAFFRFYAYEFDYKKHVVSLNPSTLSCFTERESKAETDGWKLFASLLSIEDPFETFYDIAHVLKPSYFQRTRREFALAYSKIADASFGQISRKHQVGDELLDMICKPTSEED